MEPPAPPAAGVASGDVWGEEEAMAKYLKPQDEVVENRERYRRGRKDTAVKVYTIVDESRYLIVRNLPALGAHKELLEKLALHGPIEEWRMLDQTDGGDFCDVLWVRFRSVDEAKSAKKRWDDSPFYAHPLHITYAPEYETEAETWEKLQRRRMAIAARLVEIGTSHEHVPERGKRPRHVDRQRTVLKPIATDQLRFMAPSQPLTVPAAPAPPAPPAPRVPFDGTPDSSSAEVRERLRRLNDGAPMPEVVAPPAKKAAKRTDRVRI